MLRGSVGIAERAEQIKWWDALDALPHERGLALARECRHPDALWLTSLLPAGGEVTAERMLQVMREQGDDPRALFVAWRAENRHSDLTRAAAAGYAPAQAQLSYESSGVEALVWAEKAAAQYDRFGIFVLGNCHYRGQLGDMRKERGVELFREAAELGCAAAQCRYGEVAFGKFDWLRYYWWVRALSPGVNAGLYFAVLELIPSLLNGELNRVLHTLGPSIRAHLDVEKRTLFGTPVMGDETEKLRRVVDLYDAMLLCAKESIVCWSVVGLRFGLVKDVRVLIGKLAWQEAWRWSGKN
jgi:hypothetical protein